ncbi:MAG: T9SS type A sorting domain-containing protein, partial [Ignavibacteriae bacterium]|nr:T9SS type A sorting domain-containing protein [Ignavibacteriota bacterium]
QDESDELESEQEEQVRTYALHQSYPNPFNPNTVIRYQLANNILVTLKVYDVLGRTVTTLVNEIQEAGEYSVELDGSELPSGVYYYRLTAGQFVQTNKMILTK